MNTNTATATAPATIASLKAKAERAEYRYDELANELDEAQHEAECARNECDEFAEGGRLTEWERELLSDMKREARRLETVARRLAVKLTNAEQAWARALEAVGTAEGQAIISEVEVIDDSAIEAGAEYDANAEAKAIRAEQIEEALEGYIAQRDANAKAKAQAEAERAEVENLEREAQALKETRKNTDAIGEAAFNRYRNTGETYHKGEVLQYIENSARINARLDEISARLIELGDLTK